MLLDLLLDLLFVDDFDFEVDLDFLSSHFFVSKFHLSREFKKATGLTVGNYLNSRRINKAKERLAFELTKEVHGEEKAQTAQSQAQAAFGGGSAELLTKEISGVETVVDAMVAAGVAKSKGEARRLIEQGGVSVDETKVTDVNMPLPSAEFVLHKGKKVHLKIIVK